MINTQHDLKVLNKALACRHLLLEAELKCSNCFNFHTKQDQVWELPDVVWSNEIDVDEYSPPLPQQKLLLCLSNTLFLWDLSLRLHNSSPRVECCVWRATLLVSVIDLVEIFVPFKPRKQQMWVVLVLDISSIAWIFLLQMTWWIVQLSGDLFVVSASACVGSRIVGEWWLLSQLNMI